MKIFWKMTIIDKYEDRNIIINLIIKKKQRQNFMKKNIIYRRRKMTF